MGHGFKCEALEDRVLLSSGDLDSTFGNAGYVVLPGGQNGSWKAIAPLSSGGYVLVGQFATDDLMVARYSSAWALDSTFGTAGVADYPLATTITDLHVNVRSDNKIVIGGDFAGTQETFRLTQSGALDSTFGKQGFVEGFNAEVLQSDGSMIGMSGTLLQRRSPRAGLLDSTFADNGSFDLLSGTQDDELFSPAIIQLQTDGKIVVGAGIRISKKGSDDGFIIRRLLSTGQTDPAFAKDSFIQRDDLDLTALALAPNGQIFVAGISNGVFPDLPDQLLELNTSGELNSSFQPAAGGANQIAFASNGDIDLLFDVESPVGDITYGVEQLLPDGSQDPRFDGDRVYSFSDFGGDVELEQGNNLLLIGSLEDYSLDAILPAVSRIATQDDGSPIQRYSHSDLLVFYGTDKADHISVTRTATSFTASMNGISKTFLRSHVRNISVTGGAGNDVISIDGKDTNIAIDGGDGADHITIRSGNYAIVSGGNGNDTVDGSGIDPAYTGGLYATGDAGNDSILGSHQGDDLEGNSGNDTLDGNGGTNDGLYGGTGNDLLIHGSMIANGGTGDDTIIDRETLRDL